MRVRWRGLELPSRVATDRSSMSETYGRFSIEPFERGFGVTIGSSLRQVLLSALEGSAITEFGIPGVTEETTNIAGVVEDITDIILNIKGVIVRNTSDEPKVIRIDISKDKSKIGPIRASDIVADPCIEFVNPDHVIATLKEEVSFKCEMKVENGRGYRPAPSVPSKEDQTFQQYRKYCQRLSTEFGADDSLIKDLSDRLFEGAVRKKICGADKDITLDERRTGDRVLRGLDELTSKNPSDKLKKLVEEIKKYFDPKKQFNAKDLEFEMMRPIDSNFSPVTNVKYEIGETRVGQKTNFDKLVMQIWTNGSISPQGALVEASKIFRKNLNPFIQYSEPGPEIPIDDRPDTASGAGDSELERKLSMSLSGLELSVRATNCLETEGISTVRDLLSRSEDDLLLVRNFGETTLKEVKQKLSEHGLELGQRIPGTPRR